MKRVRKNWKVYIPLAVIVLLVIIAGVSWYLDYLRYIKTDDAYVASDNISVGSKLMGRISKLYVQEGDSVKKGQLLVELDSVDLLAQKQQVLAVKAQTVAARLQSEAKYKFDVKNIKVLQIAFAKSNDDFLRAKTQYAGDVITKEQFDHVKKVWKLLRRRLMWLKLS